jgi:PhnB protein
MRFIIIVKATKDSEAGVMPPDALISAMADYHQQLTDAGILVDASGLQSSANGWRIQYAGEERTFVDGPFAEAKELVAGYTIIQVSSRDEAIAWTKRFPNPSIDGKQGEIEVRRLFELEDFEPGEGVERFRKIESQKSGGRTETHPQPAKDCPEGMHTVTPHLVCAGAAEAIEFYKMAFSAQELARLPGPDGKIVHAMIRVGDSMIMIADEFPEMGSFGPKSLNGSPVTIHLYVENVDAFVARAVEAGAKVTMPVENMFWGDRYGQLEDPFGHHWSVATHLRDVTPEELERGAREGCGRHQP